MNIKTNLTHAKLIYKFSFFRIKFNSNEVLRLKLFFNKKFQKTTRIVYFYSANLLSLKHFNKRYVKKFKLQFNSFFK